MLRKGVSEKGLPELALKWTQRATA